MNDYAAFAGIATTTLADVLGAGCALDCSIRPLWNGMPRIAGPAFPVSCPPGDNLMLHAAIYRAPAGSVIIAQSGELRGALAGGNVCAVAQRNGIAGFVLDGLARDIGEIRERAFPVFARGSFPVTAAKDALGTLNRPIVCGGVAVSPADLIVADEDGIVVVPAAGIARVLEAARTRARRDAGMSLDQWQADHQRRIAEALQRAGFTD